MKVSKETKEHSLKMLRKFLKPGSKVYTVLRNVPRSGMTRRIDLYTFAKDGTKLFLTGYAAHLLEEPWGDSGMRVTGCGMDMGFHIVYNLSYVLFKAGFRCIGKKCRSNDHTNAHYEKKTYKRGDLHSDPGYALNQEWI